MIAPLLLALVVSAEPTAAQRELLVTFRKEFVQLTPGKGAFPKSFVPGDASLLTEQERTRQAVPMQDFAIAKYEVPQNLYEAVMGKNPSRWKGPRNSVEMVSHGDAVSFCRRATELMRAAELITAKQQIVLPSEQEWEYACKAGTTTAYSFGDDPQQLGEYAWYTGNAAGNDPPVGAKKPNPWGLYDMHGYLWEWTSTTCMKAGKQHSQHVTKGGSWQESAALLTSHFTNCVRDEIEHPGLGFRCVLKQAGQ